MKKTVLIIGGSAFTGRVFSIKAARTGEFDLHVVNRGNFPLELDGVTEYKCNRHSPRMIARLVPDIKYDALVDFCAYEPGEIKAVIDALRGRIKQYVFFSTASVYTAEGDTPPREEDPIVEGDYDGEQADYILKKIALERELIDTCDKAGIKYTILRPTFIYGPFNYSPRESFFIELIARKHTVPVPTDSTAKFNFVYVIDIARALMECIGNEKAYNETFNLAGVENVTYAQLISDFERYNAGPFDIKEVTVRQVEEENIPLPFPLMESIVYNGEKFAKTFDFEYTPFSEGMEKTFNIFYSLFTT